MKHAHAGFEIDHEGKDSYRMRRTGVRQTIVAGGGQVAVIDDAEREPALGHVIERYARDDLDLLVVEGWKHEPVPKIEVARAALGREYACAGDPRLLAVVSDFDPPAGVRRFALDDAAGVADLVASRAR